MISCATNDDSWVIHQMQYIVNSNSIFDEYSRVPNWEERFLSSKRPIKIPNSDVSIDIYELMSDYAGGKRIRVVCYFSNGFKYLFPLTDDFFYERMLGFYRKEDLEESLGGNNSDLAWKCALLAKEQLSNEKHLNYILSNRDITSGESSVDVTLSTKQLLDAVFLNSMGCTSVSKPELRVESNLLQSDEKVLSLMKFEYYKSLLDNLDSLLSDKNGIRYVYKRSYFTYYVVSLTKQGKSVEIEMLGKELFQFSN